MFLMMLEKMEISEGFKNLERKTNRTHFAAVTLIPKRNLYSNIKFFGQELRELEGLSMGEHIIKSP